MLLTAAGCRAPATRASAARSAVEACRPGRRGAENPAAGSARSHGSRPPGPRKPATQETQPNARVPCLPPFLTGDTPRRRCEWAGVEAVAAADAQVLVVQHHAFLGLIKAVDRADGGTRCVRAVHAGDRDRPLTRLAVVDGDDAAPVDAPRHLMLVLAGGDA